MTIAASTETHRAKFDAWTWYLVLAVCLAPVLVPPGPGRSALLDPFNVIAIGVFASTFAISRRGIQVPFIMPVFLMSLGSLVATANAVNAPAAIFTLLQDAYLYVWFVVLVNVLQEHGDLRSLRVAWVVTGCCVAVIGLVQVAVRGGEASLMGVLNPKGFRAMGTFDQPDELADYLAMSVFMALSLSQGAGRFLRWGAIALILVAMAATKANGGLFSLAAGLAAWALVRVWTLGVSPAGWIAGGLVAVSTVLIVVWMVAGLGVGAAQLSRLEANSFLGRMGHSSEGREMIWKSLSRRYARSPMGIGPGNSRWQTVTIEERERPIAGHLDTFDTGADPFLSKESHNDYIAYLLERGPVALAGMLLLRWQIFVRILKGRVGARATRERMATGAVTAAMFGAWVASCLNSNTIETLHFRHVWVFLAMVCAMELRSASAKPSWGAPSAIAPPLSPARMSS